MQDYNWIDLKEFRCISENIFKIEFHTFNTQPKFDNLNGIEHFKNLKEVAFCYLYANKINLEKLTECPNLEYVSLENTLTKTHHKALNKLKNLKKLSVKGLDVSLLEEFPKLEELYVLGLKNADDLHIKMPNLKSFSAHKTTKITSLDFLQRLQKLENATINGFSNVEELPNLKNMKTLRVFSIMNMKRLQKVANFPKNLERLRIAENIPLLTPNNLTMLTKENLPNLKDVTIKLCFADYSKKVLQKLGKD